MRVVKNEAMLLGEVDISNIQFDERSRDEMPQLLKGLQFIYCNHDLRKKVFFELEKIIDPKIKKDKGRKGMELWHILVLGTVRLASNWNYDKLKDQADNHQALRQMLGIGAFNDEKKFPLQTLKDNVSLLTPESLNNINEIVVKAGQKLLKKKLKT